MGWASMIMILLIYRVENRDVRRLSHDVSDQLDQCMTVHQCIVCLTQPRYFVYTPSP